MLKIIRVKEFGLHRDSITTQYFALPWTLCYFNNLTNLLLSMDSPSGQITTLWGSKYQPIW